MAGPAASAGTASPEPNGPRWLRARLVGATTDDLEQTKIRSAKRESGIKGYTQAPRCAFVEVPPMEVSPPEHPHSLPPVVLPLQPLEVSHEFYPFGVRPAPGAAFYLESPLLQRRDALIRIQFDIRKSLPAAESNAVEVHWEYLSQDQGWQPLGVTRGSGVNTSAHELKDETQAFTKHGRGYVEFRCPPDVAGARLGGQFGYFVPGQTPGGELGRAG